ncbi:hypothetical protein D9M70_545870 [compost metagenome]
MRHLSNPALAAGGQAQRVKCDVDALQSSDSITNRFRQLSFAGSNIPGENHERRAAKHRLKHRGCTRMMLFDPICKTGRIDQHAQNFGKPIFLVVQSDESCEPLLRLEVRVGNPALEQLVE